MASKVDMKVVLLGQESSGKTCLVERYRNGKFTGVSQNTVGAAFGAKAVQLRNRTVTLGVWDTAGSERYESMTKIYYRNADAAIVCYDLTNAASFERVKYWVNEVQQQESSCMIILCGTKKDLLAEGQARGVSADVVEDYASELGVRTFETSSKTGENVEAMFKSVAEDTDNATVETRDRRDTVAPKQTDPPPPEKCC